MMPVRYKWMCKSRSLHSKLAYEDEMAQTTPRAALGWSRGCRVGAAPKDASLHTSDLKLAHVFSAVEAMTQRQSGEAP
eukprot:6201251-Pleurochrysis_carterae.AAC.1